MTIDRPAAGTQPQLRALWREAFGDTEEYLELYFSVAFHPERCRCVLEEGRVLAALYWLDGSCRGKRIAYLYAVATAEACRGRGIGSRLLEDTHSHLARLGYGGAALVPGEESLFRFYERLGYRVCSRVTEFFCAGSPEPVGLRRLTAAEYAAQRRAMLKPGGVIQEGAALALLAAQCGFYAGPGFLLAARAEGELLEGVELLGDPRLAPSAVTALGCRKGRFRTPGEGRDFAMFYPLAPDAEPPAYFGLALD